MLTWHFFQRVLRLRGCDEHLEVKMKSDASYTSLPNGALHQVKVKADAFTPDRPQLKQAQSRGPRNLTKSKNKH